ncbi:hydrolase [Clostridium fermenticellae]|uniref:Hydrolase n=1 Tax=Clostridium fermenticellae TaxID=2068654 RepID=A0A386H5M6_9CLOT|nr:hydrolase [Clostridium fermenticellae]AYD40956.1 hydrolase [Clostridium fermenticellae]
MTGIYDSKVSEELKKEVDSFISKSNASADDFIKLLAESYNVNLTPLDLSYGDYWNSFTD